MDEKNKNAIDIYNSIAEDYAKTFDPKQSEEDLKFLNIFLSHLKLGNKILDIGCGTGFSSKYFTGKGMLTEGIDLSEGMIAIAKRNYPSLSFQIADLRDFIPEEHVDAVWAGYSLFHFEKEYLEETFNLIKSYLKPAGIFGLVIQEGYGEIEMDEPFMPDKKIYIHLYTVEEMTEILNKYGFEVVDSSIKKAEVFGFPFDKVLIIARLK